MITDMRAVERAGDLIKRAHGQIDELRAEAKPIRARQLEMGRALDRLEIASDPFLRAVLRGMSQ